MIQDHHEPRIAHGFTIGVAEESGEPSIFLINLFPEYITALEKHKGGGTIVSYKPAQQREGSFRSPANIEQIERLIQECKRLDAELAK